MIVDTFTAGPRCTGWAGGQLWQLYTLQERGADWFASESDGAYALANGTTAERRMLVKFMDSPGLTIDAERVQPATMHAPKADGSKHREYFTTYSKRIRSTTCDGSAARMGAFCWTKPRPVWGPTPWRTAGA